MSNILIDIYHLQPKSSEWRKFFQKHLIEYPTWIEDNIEAYKERTGKDWFEGSDFVRMLDDQLRIKEIIDNFWEKNSITTENLSWLQEMQKSLQQHLHETPTLDRRESNIIDLGKNRLVLSYYEVRHGIGLQPIYKAIFSELISLLRGEKMSLKKCQVCGKLVKPTPSGFTQKFCSAACKMKDFRQRKKNRNFCP